jgi:hypothetical protein
MIKLSPQLVSGLDPERVSVKFQLNPRFVTGFADGSQKKALVV